SAVELLSLSISNVKPVVDVVPVPAPWPAVDSRPLPSIARPRPTLTPPIVEPVAIGNLAASKTPELMLLAARLVMPDPLPAKFVAGNRPVDVAAPPAAIVNLVATPVSTIEKSLLATSACQLLAPLVKVRCAAPVVM